VTNLPYSSNPEDNNVSLFIIKIRYKFPCVYARWPLQIVHMLQLMRT